MCLEVRSSAGQVCFSFLLELVFLIMGIWNFFWNSRFDLFLPLHHLWMGYMSELLGLSREPSNASTSAMAKAMPSSASMHPKLLKADFHGSIMTGLYSSYYSILAHIMNLSSPEQESLSLRSLGNRDPWNWERVQNCNKAWQIERYIQTGTGRISSMS